MTNMTIAYVLKKFPRLSETFVLNEMLRVEALGSRVHVFSRREVDDEPRHAQLAQLRATVELLPSRLDPWKELFVELDAKHVLERLGPVVRDMQRHDGVRLTKLLAEALYLRRRLAELDVGHVHVHFATESAVVALLVRLLGGPTYSVTAHAKDIYRSTVDPALLSRILEESSFTVTVCDANVRHLRGMVTPAAGERVRRLYNGIDLGAFAPSDRPRDEGHILAVGRLVEKKGFDVLIRAVARLVERGSACRVTIVGEGDDRPRLEALIRSLELADTVTLTGPMEQARVRELIERATVFCLPCVIGADGNRDALPTVLLEALASGLPVVSTPVTGIPEILGDGEAGRLVPERDVDATAAAIDELLTDGAARERLCTAGRARAEALFDGGAAAGTLTRWFQEATTETVGA